MSFKRLNGLSGFDMSVPDYELRDQIKEKESVICSYFTDDFKTNFTTPLGPDVKIHIRPLETKVSITVMSQYGDFDFTISTFTYLQWKWVVLDSLLSVIKNTYGERPYKEAKDVISKIMNPDGGSMLSSSLNDSKRPLTIRSFMASMSSMPSFLGVIRNSSGSDEGSNLLELEARYGTSLKDTRNERVKSKPANANVRPLMEITEPNISKKKLYEILNKALETPFSIPFAKKDINVNGPYPLSACKKDDPKYISIRLANGSLVYLGLCIKGTKKNPRYIFTL